MQLLAGAGRIGRIRRRLQRRLQCGQPAIRIDQVGWLPAEVGQDFGLGVAHRTGEHVCRSPAGAGIVLALALDDQRVGLAHRVLIRVQVVRAGGRNAECQGYAHPGEEGKAA